MATYGWKEVVLKSRSQETVTQCLNSQMNLGLTRAILSDMGGGVFRSTTVSSNTTSLYSFQNFLWKRLKGQHSLCLLTRSDRVGHKYFFIKTLLECAIFYYFPFNISWYSLLTEINKNTQKCIKSKQNKTIKTHNKTKIKYVKNTLQ